MLTIKELLPLFQFGSHDEDDRCEKLCVSANGHITDISPNNPLDMAAYGDFIVDYIYFDKYGAEIAIKADFRKAGA